jgi:DNA-binding MarR family transcriptional regulator
VPAPAHLSPHQLVALDAVRELGEPTIREVAQWTGQPKSGVVDTIQSLVRRGLIAPAGPPAAADRHAVRYRLVPARATCAA